MMEQSCVSQILVRLLKLKCSKGAVSDADLAEAFADVLILLLPIWLSVLTGLILGWSWRPRWVSLLTVAIRSKPRLICSLGFTLPDSDVSERYKWWAAAAAAAAAPTMGALFHATWFAVTRSWLRMRVGLGVREKERDDGATLEHTREENEGECWSEVLLADQQRRLGAPLTDEEGKNGAAPSSAVAVEDLNRLCSLLEEEDGGPAWGALMDKECEGMKYTAWRRDPEVGPTQYRSRTVIERCTSQVMRDFFWDDDFRVSNGWDNMLVKSSAVEECHVTGTQVVHWVRKFPFFCKDRDYVIARRIWSAGDFFYCVTKGLDHPGVPLHPNIKRVTVFHSSWRIRPLEDGSCEVLLFHWEDLHLNPSIAKFGIAKGMWPAVKRVEPGVRAYQHKRTASLGTDECNQLQLSRSALMADINTPLSVAAVKGMAMEGRGGLDLMGANGLWSSVSDTEDTFRNRSSSVWSEAEEGKDSLSFVRGKKVVERQGRQAKRLVGMIGAVYLVCRLSGFGLPAGFLVATALGYRFSRQVSVG